MLWARAKWLAGILPSLAACAERHPYPPAWPARAVVEECPHVSATYANAGETSMGVTVYLSQVLQFHGYGAEYDNPEDVASVRIDGPRDRKLAVELRSGAGVVVRSIVYSESAGDFGCTKGGLVRSSGMTLRLFGSDSAKLQLTTNATGDLVVKRTESVWDLLPLPTFATYEDYVRFERVP